MLMLLEGHTGLSPEPLSAMPLGLLLSNTSASQRDNMKEKYYRYFQGGKRSLSIFAIVLWVKQDSLKASSFPLHQVSLLAASTHASAPGAIRAP